MRPKNASRALVALLAFALGTTQGVGAFTLEPISTSISPSGPGSITTFRIRSEEQEKIAIRFRVLTRDSAPDGSEVNGPADDQFLIYPSRVVIEPGSQAAVKIQWRGPETLTSEACYRFIAEQVPIETGKPESSGIKVMFRYIAALYVREPSFAPALDLSVVGSQNADGQSGFLVKISNEGTRHVVALNPIVTIGGGIFRLSSRDLGKLAGRNYLPGRGLAVFVPQSGAAVGRSYDARLDYEGAY